jgi:hypothetical protein
MKGYICVKFKYLIYVFNFKCVYMLENDLALEGRVKKSDDA